MAARTLVGPERLDDPINASMRESPLDRDPALPGPFVGGFDERFPRDFCEDSDLALRLTEASWRLEQGRRSVLHPVRPSGFSAWFLLRHRSWFSRHRLLGRGPIRCGALLLGRHSISTFRASERAIYPRGYSGKPLRGLRPSEDLSDITSAWIDAAWRDGAGVSAVVSRSCSGSSPNRESSGPRPA
jgi:hypothetical protein